jgi:zinc protease
MKEVERFKKQGPATEELEKAKEMLKREHEQNLKENDYWLGSLQMVYANDLDPRDLLGFDGRLDSITFDSIRQKAQDLLSMDRYVQLVLYPEGAPKK